MKYTKLPITLDEQLNKLIERGLIVKDAEKAKHYLSNISYYRLRAYTYPFQDNTTEEHIFIKKITFEEVIELYVFDRKLRALIFDTLEKIEISMRTKIIYHYALNHGSHWYLNDNLFRDVQRFNKQLEKLNLEIKRSSETFIKHYFEKYTAPSEPPVWMSLEVSSFGLLSLFFGNLKNDKEKRTILKEYGLFDVKVLESWMHSFSNVRNICAHHGRLWNRRLTAHIVIPNTTKFKFLNNKNILQYKVYAIFCSIQYILNIINPESTFKTKLLELMANCPLAQEKEMGFPKNWKEEPLWQ